MLLGKRPMRRTTSMTGITIDIPNSSDHFTDPHHQPLPFPNFNNNNLIPVPHNNNTSNWSNNSINHRQVDVQNRRFLAGMVSPTNIHRRNSDEFLTTCGLCKRRLAAGKDIYMYRGDTAFCSQECREKQMKQDA
ncbi:FCS-Like Zinc finger 7-like [Euphorbia lathyris]|uniref:FCS-Like Zinc finger 7-like n=1 Tax=Euphorbia lathyris TaxID=212925 RepID=UPI003313BE65